MFNSKLEFNNIPNAPILTMDGKSIYPSLRSPTVALVLIVNGKILLLKRGFGCPDEVGKWVFPCGYVDGNETLKEAIIRETYEETGINLIEYHDYLINHSHSLIMSNSFNDDEGTPRFVRSSPKKDARQNITNYMCLVVESENSIINAPWNGIKNPETDEVVWIELDSVFSLDIGFGHDEIIKKIMD